MKRDMVRENNIEFVPQTTLELFAKQHIEEITMDKITQASHLTPRPLVNYFRCRKNLLIQVIKKADAPKKEQVDVVVKAEAYRKQCGLGQVLLIVRRILTISIQMTATVCGATKLKQAVGAVPVAGDATTIQYILSSAMKKGLLEDSSIRSGISIDDLTGALAINLFGAANELALICQDPDLYPGINAQQVIEQYVICTQTMLQSQPQGTIAQTGAYSQSISRR